MLSLIDRSVVAAVLRTVREFRHEGPNTTAGEQFERAVYDAVFDVHAWQHVSAPDQFDMSLPITSRTGVRYEFDGVFMSADTLYIIEAKYLAREKLAREHVGIFIQKLLDTSLGSYDEIGHLAIKPIIASGLPAIDGAARQQAVAWGVLLLSPDQVTPFEILETILTQRVQGGPKGMLASECEQLAGQLWRPFNDILRPVGDGDRLFSLHADRIYHADDVRRLLDQCQECHMSAESMGLPVPRTELSRR